LLITEACPGSGANSGIPTYTNQLAVANNMYSNGQLVVLQCVTGYAISNTVTCTCDTSGDTNMFRCDSSDAPTCALSKFKVFAV